MPVASQARRLLLGDSSPRADAERNVDALLSATRELVTAGDLNPAAAQIAERAGVGVGTLYRRALRKETLLAATVLDLLDEVNAQADSDETSASWSGFESFAIDYIRIREVTCSITHSLDAEFDGALIAAKERTRAAFTALTARLCKAGILSEDITAEDLMTLLASIDITDDSLDLRPDPARRERVLRRLLSSLRPVDEVWRIRPAEHRLR
ncbi:TetR family transcriptional regulator [Galbitalea sp. SE-J8]|uniref:TetR/AcrR family transcriptional regulator n=1 Tax=Galbitalea sp. SE-J8 TaxID=3054952 RepID=UPI00259D0EC8|nr:TetR family transcriptional regulator [Galbitalea sp. SE-J8]MDM4761976.1 TetR family transcriptional regulator [Galbitalea sp. SE-J8]